MRFDNFILEVPINQSEIFKTKKDWVILLLYYFTYIIFY
jgi:hypothetical protein